MDLLEIFLMDQFFWSIFFQNTVLIPPKPPPLLFALEILWYMYMYVYEQGR